ncbi:hypothetical protein GN157_00320 [Flavobacterium rakeshii]|uniref:DUF3185 family protein n=1 Tax=Flavobacterium rakeshii TaxID=1038845 RepID=A0A6N8H6I5_9FLAO|nr:hypothetical protein [Flavobacterium rakeshii]MEE1898079.1 hypothetical protein [Flavobacterium rakeshii]MUV02141.1 hypothetical protein [Flavobacterium rakeshii]
MNVSKVIGIILIVISLGVGYIGVNKVADSTKAVKFLGIEIDASNESGQMQGFIYLGAAILLFAGGLYAARKSGN